MEEIERIRKCKMIKRLTVHISYQPVRHYVTKLALKTKQKRNCLNFNNKLAIGAMKRMTKIFDIMLKSTSI
jgi:hypothetical protein